MKKIVYLYALLMLFNIACEKIEKVEDFPLQPSKLVMNARIEAGEPITVELSRSLVVIDNAPLSLVGNAEVILYDQNDLELDRKNELPYSFATLAESGKRYKIVAKHPVYGEATAETKVPQIPVLLRAELDVIDSNKSAFGWQGDSSFFISFNVARLRFTLQNMTEGKGYFAIKLNGVGYETDGTEMEGSAYLSFGSENAVGELISNTLFLDESIFDGNTLNLNLSFTGNVYSAQNKFQLMLECIALSEDAWLFEKSYARYKEAKNNPFADPVQVYSNVRGGYGVVGGANSVVQKWEL